MARILLATELGANLGHIGQLLPLALALRDLRHEVTFVARDARRAAALLRAHQFDCLQAPMWRTRAGAGSAAPCSYSEILQHYGYRDAAALTALLRAWRKIILHTQPDTVVCEFAPTALLACRGLDVKRVQCGVGFSIPPRITPLPNFRTWETVPPERLQASDAAVLSTVNATLERLRLAPLARILDLLETDAEFLCTFRELDHYCDRSSGRYVGPLFMEGEGDLPTWPIRGNRRVFVYLRASAPAFAPTLNALVKLGAAAFCVAPGIAPEVRRRYESANLVFSEAPIRLASVANTADAAVLHGGHGTVAAMLLRGVALVLCPEHAEHGIVGRNVGALGAGRVATPQWQAGAVVEALRAVLDDPAYRTAARAFAATHADFSVASAAPKIADDITAL